MHELYAEFEQQLPGRFSLNQSIFHSISQLLTIVQRKSARRVFIIFKQ